MLAGDALRMELHPEGRAVNVLNTHDQPVIALRTDLELGGCA